MQNGARTVAIFVIAATPLVASSRQADPLKTLTGHVVVTTSETRRTTAVLGRKAAGGEAEFLFCIDHAKPVSQKIEFTGSARVLYRAALPPSLPAGVEVSGPEQVLPALAIVPATGKTLLFLGSGQKAPLASGDPAAGDATTVTVSGISRMDWIARDGKRRGTDLEGCLSPGG